MLKAKIRKLVELCSGRRTLILTDLVSEIVEPIREALKEAGIRSSVFIGSEKESTFGAHDNAVAEFNSGLTDVLIGSTRCIATGTDGLQHNCSQLVFATLPWTHADWIQAIGRLAREGQQHAIDIHLLLAEIDWINRRGERQFFSPDAKRWDTINRKRTLAQAAVDGVLPKSEELLSENRMATYASNWLKRLEEDQVIRRQQRHVVIPLRGELLKTA